MHASVMEWLAQVRAEMGDISEWEVIEVGSYNENGSPREVFQADVFSYIGIDSRPGRDVDEVMEARDLRGPGGYNLVICTEMLEHDPRPWLSVPAMAGLLTRGGHLLLTARGFGPYGGYPEHPCPDDYWRFNISSFTVLLQDAGLRIVEVTRDSGKEAPGVFAHAIKP